MNIVLRKQERTARHKSNKNTMRLCFRKLHDWYNFLSTDFCSCNPLQSQKTPGSPKDTKHPCVYNQSKVLLARAQGDHLIKK